MSLLLQDRRPSRGEIPKLLRNSWFQNYSFGSQLLFDSNNGMMRNLYKNILLISDRYSPMSTGRLSRIEQDLMTIFTFVTLFKFSIHKFEGWIRRIHLLATLLKRLPTSASLIESKSSDMWISVPFKKSSKCLRCRKHWRGIPEWKKGRLLTSPKSPQPVEMRRNKIIGKKEGEKDRMEYLPLFSTA